ncbi:hypothetical protein [Hyphomonas johnsonii]|nr:hypothetical protein [Hyphomonas johnsonii]
MPLRPIHGRALGALCAVAFGLTACGQTNADSLAPEQKANAASADAVCLERLPDEIAVPDAFVVETCTQSEKMTTFRGRATPAQDIDAVFGALKSTYKAAGFTLYDNSNGKIRSVIFGGSGHRKGEIQLNPKDGFLAVAVNLYPLEMEQ